MLFIGIYLSSICQVYGNPIQEGIFPTSSGLSAQIIGDRVNIRNYPGMDGKIIKNIDTTSVKVIGKNDKWYKVITDQQEGWIYSQYVAIDYPELIPYAKVKGEEIVAYSLQFIGTPYVWGGNDLKRGVDCSGFTQEVYDAFDISLSRVSYMQATDGQTVSRERLKSGDLIFFDTEGINNGQISHVGIYIGQDKFVHSDSTKGVMISSLKSNYYQRNYVKGVRVYT